MFDGFLKLDTLEMLLTPPEFEGLQANDKYALGWAIFDGVEGEPSYGHGGGSVGGTTMFIINPEHNISAAVICNLSQCFTGDDSKKLFELVFSFLENERIEDDP